MTIDIYDPGFELPPAAPGVGRTTQAPAVATPIALGILDNGKPNFDELMGRVVSLAAGVRSDLPVEWRSKSSASRPVADAVLAELVERCRLVFTGSAD